MAGLSSFLALLLAVTLWVVLRDHEYVARTPDRTTDGIQPAAAAAALRDLEEAIRSGDADAAAALAPPADTAAARRLRAVVRNARRIPLRGVSLRYLEERGGVDPDGEWTADVDLAWRFAEVDPRASRAEVQARFATTHGGAVSIVALGSPGGRRPVWLAGPVEVRRGPRTLVVAGEQADRYQRLARRAVAVVGRVVPRWSARLVVEVPATARALDRALAVEPGTFGNVAGVTVVPDDHADARAPVHVFLNPERLGTLRPQGAQVVVSHEAAHVALGATSTTLPVWLTEGFADYVALRDVDLPLSTTAAQIREQVRREGPPKRLPGEADFDEDSSHFGAAYEAAWLACRMLVARVGEQRMLRFYRRADTAPDFGRLFRTTFGISERGFTRRWRQALSDLPA